MTTTPGRTNMKRLLLATALTLGLGLLAPAQAVTPQPDYTVTGWTGAATVTPGGLFTRTLTITNIGNAGGTWPVTATVNQMPHVDYVSTVAPGFHHCTVYKFSSGAFNYVRCFNAYLPPGAATTVVVTFRAAPAAWVGYVYTGGGRVAATSMETESDTSNNYSGVGLTTTIVAGP